MTVAFTPEAFRRTAAGQVTLRLGAVASTFVSSDALSGLDPTKTGETWLPSNTASGAGAYTYSARATDNAGNSDSYGPKTYTVSYGSAFSGVLQPINADGSSRFKLGSTVPVKFALTNSAASSIGGAVATLSVAKISNSIEGIFVEAASTSNATTGSLFRYDATGQQYIFNLATKGLTTGTYSLKITLDDGTTYTQHISLK